MARALLLLTTFAALAAWAGAQGPAPPLSPADRVKLFKTNRTLVENLVNHGMELSDAEDALKRAEACGRTASTLANYLKRAAADDQNADRVVELADLLSVVVRDGLAPNLDEATRTIPPESKAARQKLTDVRDGAAADIDSIAPVIPAGKVGDSAKVKAALEALAALRAQIKK